MVRVIYLSFFFVWRILSFHCHSPSYSGFSQIFHIPLSFHCHSPHSPHSVSTNFPSHSPVHSVSPHFPSFSSHSTVIWFPLVPLSFPSFGFSNSPVIPLITLGFPSCIPSSLSAVLSWLFSLGCLSLPLFSLGSLSPFPCSLKKQDNITDSRGRRAGRLDLKDLLLIPSSYPSLPRQFPLLFASLSLFWIRWRENKVGTGWGSCRMCKKNCVFLWLACDEFGWVFLWACLNVTRRWRRKLGMGKKLTGSFPNHDGLFA